MHLFYDPHIVDEGSHQLSEEESKHAARVLRLQQGDEVQLLNGNGVRYTCVIRDAHPKRCLLEIQSKEEAPLETQIHLAVSPTKQMERMEWFVEKATEVGVTEITFLSCANSERVQLKLDRLEKKAISALKQSKRMYLPRINGLINFNDFIESHPNGMLAHCYDGEKKTIQEALADQKALVLIGPEGDFSYDEVNRSLEQGYKVITLGENRLRTETAALYATLQMKWILG